MTKRTGQVLLSLALIGWAVVIGAPRAFAHGEAADEPFLKNLTTAFFDVSVSPTEIQVGDPVTITGRVKILETWPHTLYTPEIASIIPVVPWAGVPAQGADGQRRSLDRLISLSKRAGSMSSAW